jgi:hypothetical protein
MDRAPDLSCPYRQRLTAWTSGTRLRIRRLGIRVPPSALSKPALSGAGDSGRNRDGQELRCADLLRDWLAVSP